MSGASEPTLNLFKEMDPALYIFILTKAVFIYIAGSKKNEDIPDFFKIDTKELILVMRQELNNEEVLRQLQELTTDPDAFERTQESQAIQEAFNRLRSIASGELQGNGSLLVTSCWQKAAAKLSDSGNLATASLTRTNQDDSVSVIFDPEFLKEQINTGELTPIVDNATPIAR